MRRKRIPMKFRRGNIHGGKLWANRNECKMTDKIAGEIIERVYLTKGATLPQLKQVRHTLSYSYYLMTGTSEDNWPEVHAQWESFDPTTLPASKKSLKAVRIPTPENIKEAFKKPWTPQHPMTLFTFAVAALAAHDYFIFGLRPKVDMDKVKYSKSHVINTNERYGFTAMKGGRSKLQGNKKGTRAWNVYRVCFCRGGKHVSPPQNIHLNNNGNPTDRVRWNTCCPLAIMEFMHNLQGPQWKPYPKWNDSGTVSRNNEGYVQGIANQWLQNQLHLPAFDANSGRKALARWLDFLKVVYEVGFEVHGDLPSTWRKAYQPKVPKTKFEDRAQSRCPDEVTKALRTFASWLFEDQPKPSVKQQLQTILATMD